MTRETITTPDGSFVLWFSDKGLSAVHFPRDHGCDEGPGSTGSATSPRPPRKWLAEAREAIGDVLRGRRPRATPPLDLRAGTEFQRTVWGVLRGIPLGQTLSYAEVARAVGKPGASRAVGQACGANPIPLLVPCHRVLAANRRLGGFSGGLDWKRRLLKREGVEIEPPASRGGES